MLHCFASETQRSFLRISIKAVCHRRRKVLIIARREEVRVRVDRVDEKRLNGMAIMKQNHRVVHTLWHNVKSFVSRSVRIDAGEAASRMLSTVYMSGRGTGQAPDNTGQDFGRFPLT